jgi:hypothetical protein
MLLIDDSSCQQLSPNQNITGISQELDYREQKQDPKKHAKIAIGILTCIGSCQERQ